MKIKFFSFLFCTIIFISCSVQKRLYRKGYFIDLGKKSYTFTSKQSIIPKNCCSDVFKNNGCTTALVDTIKSTNHINIAYLSRSNGKMPFESLIKTKSKKTSIQDTKMFFSNYNKILSDTLNKEELFFHKAIHYEVSKVVYKTMLVLFGVQIPYLLSIMFESFIWLYSPFLVTLNTIIAWSMFGLFLFSLIYFLVLVIAKGNVKAQKIFALICAGYLIYRFLIFILLTLFSYAA
jgi:hypothetical protein